MEGQGDASDKRKSPRIDFHLSVKVQGQKEAQLVKNFGLYGIFLKADDSFQAKPGDEITIAMRLPHEEAPLELKGRVVHAAGGGVGVVFPEIAARDAMALEACFNVFKNTMPFPD